MENETNDGTTPQLPPAAAPAPLPAPPVAVAPVAPPEDVLRGLLFALPAVIAGVALTIICWRIGFVASITSFVIAYGAGYLYTQGARTFPRRGAVALVALIVVGVVIGFFGVIASDAWDVYGTLGVTGESRLTFIRENVFRGHVIKSYGGDMAMYFVFGVLGVFGTLRRLLQS